MHIVPVAVRLLLTRSLFSSCLGRCHVPVHRHRLCLLRRSQYLALVNTRRCCGRGYCLGLRPGPSLRLSVIPFADSRYRFRSLSQALPRSLTKGLSVARSLSESFSRSRSFSGFSYSRSFSRPFSWLFLRFFPGDADGPRPNLGLGLSRCFGPSFGPSPSLGPSLSTRPIRAHARSTSRALTLVLVDPDRVVPPFWKWKVREGVREPILQLSAEGLCVRGSLCKRR